MSTSNTTPRSIRLLIAGVLLLPLLGVHCFAQSKDSSEKSMDKEDDVECKLLCTTILVMFEVEVRDQWGELAADLSQKDFTVIEDGVRQEIESLQAVNKTDKNRPDGQYKLLYLPLNDRFDGKYRRVHIVVRPNENRKFTARTIHNSGLKDGNSTELSKLFGYYAIDPAKPNK